MTQIQIRNFRGIAEAEILLSKHAVLVGDNNTGKSTILEAIDLVLGPDRMSRRPVVDEHDFYGGRYIDQEGKIIPIGIEVIVTDLSEEQTRHFTDHLEWWDIETNSLIESPPAERIEAKTVDAALRLGFEGKYDEEEDDFIGETFFLSPQLEEGRQAFKTKDKRHCGFLFLRTLRTGSRALSLERGSLLDIILRLKEARLKMWEQVLGQLRELPVAEEEGQEISGILSEVQKSLSSYVPLEWATDPKMRVSDLTREHLRKTLTVFMATGAKNQDDSAHIAPFQHQGTGTINVLVLSMLSIIAELKQNVIFAMEEPEIAIPPHTQKRIINSIRGMSAQAIFTSHSPYVLEEFPPEQILTLKSKDGILTSTPAKFPEGTKPKKFREEFRKRYSEALLAKRVLITEGRTEYDCYITAARRLNELDPAQFKSLEGLGIAVFDAETDSQVAKIGGHMRSLGKTTFAVFDKQKQEQSDEIKRNVDHAFESPEKGFESLLLKQIPESKLRSFALSLVSAGDWPQHLENTPTESMSITEIQNQLKQLFGWAKGAGTAADLLADCSIDETPEFMRTALKTIKDVVEPPKDLEPEIDEQPELLMAAEAESDATEPVT